MSLFCVTLHYAHYTRAPRVMRETGEWQRETREVTNPADLACSLCHFQAGLGRGRHRAQLTLPVVRLEEVWRRSQCRPAERMVSVASERQGAVEWFFRPACVALRRCSGCCGDESARCEATATANVTLQVLLIRPLQDHRLEEMTFVEHTACECREPAQQQPPPPQQQPAPESRTPHRNGKKEPGVRRERKKHGRKPPSNAPGCPPCAPRHAHLYRQDARTCQCACKATDARCRRRGRVFNPHTCRCNGRRRRRRWEALNRSGSTSPPRPP
uniref:Vascular endothelial growth factor A-like isoform X1 n=1 Tax=Petromyzon marinus TaxID=7757 RepID=A0AAJ7X2F4_PETMA|nr:vascular endothelial growth factor A-like isoform X1 [Petromyzon marinus]